MSLSLTISSFQPTPPLWYHCCHPKAACANPFSASILHVFIKMKIKIKCTSPMRIAMVGGQALRGIAKDSNGGIVEYGLAPPS